MSFITVVPSIRTIPGVEEFDYRIDDASDLAAGDLIRVPFRRSLIPAIIIRRSKESAFAARAIELTDVKPLLRFDSAIVDLLDRSARHTFTSKPSVLLSWLRSVPKRTTPSSSPFVRGRVRQSPPYEGGAGEVYLADRWHGPNGLIETAKKTEGRVLILTPWQHRADQLARLLDARPLHSDLSDGDAWRAVSDFVEGRSQRLVATRIGAWLASQSDVVLIDEPENDDFKSDELAPRIDARWLIQKISAVSFSTTPRLSSPSSEWTQAPNIDLDLHVEPWTRRGGSPIDGLSSQTVAEIEAAREADRPVLIIHPIRGERARIRCRDCSWTAACPSCGFEVSLVGNGALCRRCGKRSDLPSVCPSCGGSDFSRGRSGKDRLEQQLKTHFNDPRIRVADLAEFHTTGLAPNSLVVVTDLSLIGGAVEDIRRKERLVIAWRRLAASLATANATAIVHGSEETLDQCRAWLTKEGLIETWTKELAERNTFGYPPAIRLVKLLVDGPESIALALMKEVSTVETRGPFPVAFRSKSRGERHVIHLVAPASMDDAALRTLLDPFKKRAIIDLDPIAFFS